jgi:hypothetical protein
MQVMHFQDTAQLDVAVASLAHLAAASEFPRIAGARRVLMERYETFAIENRLITSIFALHNQ